MSVSSFDSPRSRVWECGVDGVGQQDKVHRRLGCSRTDMSSVRLHKASVVGHHNHLVAVDGNLDRMLEPRIEEVEHKVLLTICFNNLGK